MSLAIRLPRFYLLGAVLLRLLGLGALADERLVDVGDHTACQVARGHRQHLKQAQQPKMRVR